MSHVVQGHHIQIIFTAAKIRMNHIYITQNITSIVSQYPIDIYTELKLLQINVYC